MLHCCLQVLTRRVLTAWQAELCWCRWAHPLNYRCCHCLALSSPLDCYWLFRCTDVTVCFSVFFWVLLFFPAATADKGFLHQELSNSHQSSCTVTTEHAFGKQWSLGCDINFRIQFWCVGSNIVWRSIGSIAERERHYFSRQSKRTRRCHLLRENWRGYSIRDVSHRHVDICLAKEALTNILGCLS